MSESGDSSTSVAARGAGEAARQTSLMKAGALQNAILGSANFSMVATDEKGVIQFFNASAERLLGYSAADVVDKISPSDIHDPREVVAHAQALSLEFGTPIAPGFEALAFKASRGIEDVYELTYIRKDGSRFPAMVSITALRDGSGAIIGYLLIGSDITLRRQAQDALRAREDFSRSVIQSSPDCIKVLDIEGNLLSMESGQELLGIEDIRPFLNRSWLDFWKDDDHSAARAALATAIAGGTGKFVGFFHTLHGEPKWWDVSISPIVGAHGEPARLLAVSRDVTQRKQAELNFEFLASVSHDLVTLASVDEMTRTVGAKMGAYLDLSLCAFVEISEAADQVVIFHDWHRPDVPGLVGVYRLADFVEQEFIRMARAGETIIVRDTAKDARTSPEKFAALKIASFICVPLIRDGQWRFAMCLYHSAPYDWREDEIALARELTARIWTRLERLRAEEFLRESEQRYRMLFETIDEGLCVIEMIFDEHQQAVDYRFLESNPSLERLTGMHDVIGKRVLELIPDLEMHWIEFYAKVARTGEPMRLASQVRGLGDRWLDIYACRLGGPGSSKVVVLFTNITERKLAEIALHESEERYHNLFNSIDEGFCVIEMIFDEREKPVDYRFLEVNPTFEKQTGLRDAVGKRVLELVPGIESHWFETFGKVALTGEPIRFVNEAKSMQSRWFDAYALRVGAPESRNVAIVFNDITERKRIELNLNTAIAIAGSANRAKSDFLSSMSHELRTPLSAILGFAQLIESGTPAPTVSQQRSVGQILQAGWYLLELINEILDLALVESGKLSVAPESMALAEVVYECQAMVEPQARKRAISLRFPRFDTPCFVHADRMRVKQILINLLSNAIKYNRAGGTVAVSCTAGTPGRIRIQVEDTGNGLAPHQLEQLFQPFNRLGQEAMASEGTGIGLVMSKRLAELMGGAVGVQSSVGKGSIFWVDLLLADEPPPAARAGEPNGAKPASIGSAPNLRTLLYIEDNPANLMLVEDLVARRPDLRLLTAVDATLGITLARAAQPTVILMDINLPGMDGTQAMRIMRDDPATAHIPVMALSANAIPRDITRGLEAGFFRYLTKPVRVGEFMDALDEALNFAASAISTREPVRENHDQ